MGSPIYKGLKVSQVRIFLDFYAVKNKMLILTYNLKTYSGHKNVK